MYWISNIRGKEGEEVQVAGQQKNAENTVETLLKTSMEALTNIVLIYYTVQHHLDLATFHRNRLKVTDCVVVDPVLSPHNRITLMLSWLSRELPLLFASWSLVFTRFLRSFGSEV